MSRKNLIDLEMDRIERWKKYYRDNEHYLKQIKETTRKHDPDARILIFGSYVKGDMKPDSDIDMLIITREAEDINKRLRLRREIADKIGRCTPYEIHIITPEEYITWYRKFIKNYREI